MKLTKLIALLLCLAMSIAAFAACKAEEAQEAPASQPASDKAAQSGSEGGETPSTQPAAEAKPGYGENDVTAKADYSVLLADPADENMTAVVAVDTEGKPVITNGDLQIYYWLEFYDFMNYYGSYAAYFGLDPSSALAQQPSLAENRSWEQYFLEAAAAHLGQNYALAQTAFAEGYTLSDADGEMVEDILDPQGGFAQDAKAAGHPDSLTYLQANFGTGTDLEAYQEYLRIYYAAYNYYNDNFSAYEDSVTEDMIHAHYAENAESYKESRLLNVNNVTVRHILIEPTETDLESGGFTEAGWAGAEKAINDVLALWQENPTEEYFAQLVPEHSADDGSLETGGLYEDFGTDKMVQEFSDWCFDQTRKPGDTGIVKTEYGYHLIYFVEQTETCGWMDKVKEDMAAAHMDELLAAAMEKYPLRFDYTKVVLFDLLTTMAAQEIAPEEG